MPNHEEIYAAQAATYDLLVSKQPDLSDVIASIRPPAGLDILDLGAGAGRLTCALAPKAKSILALDASETMLGITRNKLEQMGLHNWRAAIADHRALPVPDHSIDLIVSGWSLCYVGSTNAPNWRENIHAVMLEMKRVLRPGGTIIILENYGTGSETPNPPDFLTAYYGVLENEYGFSSTWMRTDYQFDNLEEAVRLTRFFFGDELADQVAAKHMVHFPECAGVWWLNL